MGSETNEADRSADLQQSESETFQVLDAVRNGDAPLSDLTKLALDKSEVRVFLAREFLFLSHVASHADLPNVVDLLDQLHLLLLYPAEALVRSPAQKLN